MLSPAEAVSEMSALLGTTVVSGKYFTRLLREDGRGLWPEFGKGNRGSVGLRHLVNLWMAYVLCGGQPNDGPCAAYEFGRLRWVKETTREAVTRPLPPNANALLGLMPPTEFRETDRYFRKTEGVNDFMLVDHLCGLVGSAVGEVLGLFATERPHKWPVICITLGSPGHPMSAEVTWPSADRAHNSEIDTYTVDDEEMLPGITLPVTPRNKLARTQVIIGRDEIMAFASLAKKTDDFGLPPMADPAPASAVDDATPETTKATEPASCGDLLSDVPATRAYPALAPAVASQAQSATKEGSKQSASRSVARGSRVRQPVTVRTRHHGANWSAASPA